MSGCMALFWNAPLCKNIDKTGEVVTWWLSGFLFQEEDSAYNLCVGSPRLREIALKNVQISKFCFRIFKMKLIKKNSDKDKYLNFPKYISDLWKDGWVVSALQGAEGEERSVTNTLPCDAARGRLEFSKIFPRSFRWSTGDGDGGGESRLLPPDRAFTIAFIVLQSESKVSRFDTRWGFFPILFNLQHKIIVFTVSMIFCYKYYPIHSTSCKISPFYTFKNIIP